MAITSEFDNLEDAAIRRIVGAQGGGGGVSDRERGGPPGGGVSGVRETRNKMKDLPVKIDKNETKKTIAELGSRLRAAVVATALAQLPGAVGAVSSSAAQGFAISGVKGAVALGALSAAKQLALREFELLDQEREARIQARGVETRGRGISDVVKQFKREGIFGSAQAAKQEVSGFISGIERGIKIDATRLPIGPLGSDVPIPFRVFSVAGERGSRTPIQKQFNWLMDRILPGPDTTRIDREFDIAQWQQRPNNSHPVAGRALNIMQSRIDASLKSGGEYFNWKKNTDRGN